MLDWINKNKTEKKELALVLGEDSRSFLSTIRSLGRAGFDVHVVCYDRKSISLKSKYITTAYFYNYQSYSIHDWIKSVYCLIERYQYKVIFPCDERAIYPLWKIRHKLLKKTKLAIANSEALDVLFDKWKTKQLAQKLNIPVALGKLVVASEHDYHELKTEFSDKFVIKPLQSFNADTLDKRNKVVIIQGENDYVQFLKNQKNTVKYLIEQYFDGNGEGLSVFSWQGEIKAAFSYKRLAEPQSGGGSSYRESNQIDTAQLQATRLICKKTKLTGLAMFEFRRNSDSNEWILVEVNARAWGGMPLAEFAGIDFPTLYVEYLCGKKIKPRNAHIYPNVRARALLSDLYEIKRESEIKAMNSTSVDAAMHLFKRTLNIMRVIKKNESFDSLRKDDMAPFFDEIKTILKNMVFQGIKNKTIFINASKNKTKKKVKLELSKKIARRIVFVCYGNIIRSPFAEVYLLKRLKSLNLNIDVESFGFHKVESRKSPDIAISAAHSFNCDLNKHRSRCLTQIDIHETDILFYFDEKNCNLISSYYKSNNAYCLSEFLDDTYAGLYEIEDPYESDVKTIKSCYMKIQNAVDNFINIHKEVLQ